MTKLDSILKRRSITLLTKVHILKAMVFPVVMYGCESWIIKKAECRRTDVFELWGRRRLLRVPWTARRSNQSILKKISPGCSLEGLMWCWSWNSNSLATSCEEPTHEKRPWFFGKDWGQEEKGMTEDEMVGWHHRQRTWVWASSRRWWGTGKPGVLQSSGSKRVRHDWATEQQQVYCCLENPRTEKPGRLHSMGLQRVRHDWAHVKASQRGRDLCFCAASLYFP